MKGMNVSLSLSLSAVATCCTLVVTGEQAS